MLSKVSYMNLVIKEVLPTDCSPRKTSWVGVRNDRKNEEKKSKERGREGEVKRLDKKEERERRGRGI